MVKLDGAPFVLNPALVATLNTSSLARYLSQCTVG